MNENDAIFKFNISDTVDIFRDWELPIGKGTVTNRRRIFRNTTHGSQYMCQYLVTAGGITEVFDEPDLKLTGQYARVVNLDGSDHANKD